MKRPIAIQQAATSPDEIAALASAVTEYQQKFCDAKGQRQSDARYQDLRATRQRLRPIGSRRRWARS